MSRVSSLLIRTYLRGIRPVRYLSTKIEEANVPIKFSTSNAAKRSPILHTKKYRDIPWYQPFIVAGSVSVFLIYFCMLREENDIDLEFNKTLYERVQGLEKEQLLQTYRYNKDNGLSVESIEQRLKEIDGEATV